MEHDKLNSLTWKYFWEQKRYEVGIFLLVLFIAWSVFSVFYGAYAFGCERENTGTTHTDWFGEVIEDTQCIQPVVHNAGFFWRINGIFCVSVWIIVAFIAWLKANWKRALRRARAKIREEQDRKKKKTKNSKKK